MTDYPVSVGFRCPQHPTSPISHRCDNCGAGMCATCEFFFPINTYVCPVCVVAPVVVSPKRKMVARLGLASTVASMTCLGIACSGTQTVGSTVMLGLTMIFTAAAGMTMSLSAMDSNRGNNRLVNVAAIVSLGWIVVFFVFCVVGMMRLANEFDKRKHAAEQDDTPRPPHHRPMPRVPVDPPPELPDR